MISHHRFIFPFEIRLKLPVTSYCATHMHIGNIHTLIYRKLCVRYLVNVKIVHGMECLSTLPFVNTGNRPGVKAILNKKAARYYVDHRI